MRQASGPGRVTAQGPATEGRRPARHGPPAREPRAAAAQSPALRAPAVRRGFALGGFPDGILAQTVLQWHHLRALRAPEAGLAFHGRRDGLFHAAQDAIACGARLALWRRRAAIASAGAGCVPAGWAVPAVAALLAGRALAALGAARARAAQPAR